MIATLKGLPEAVIKDQTALSNCKLSSKLVMVYLIDGLGIPRHFHPMGNPFLLQIEGLDLGIRD